MELVTAPIIDLDRLVSYRLDRLQRQLGTRECAAALLFDPINVNYALGTIRYPVFQFHLPSSYAFVPQSGKPTLFEDYGTHTMSVFFEREPAINLNYLHTGHRNEGAVRAFRSSIRQRLTEHGTAERRLIGHNVALLRPGLTYHEFSRQSWKPPTPFGEQRYPLLAHGMGLCDEHPLIVAPEKWQREGVEGAFEPGMVICLDTAFFPLIESEQGVANAEAIAAVPGVDCLYIGHVNLSVDLGIAGQYEHPRMLESIEAVAAAARRHGKSFAWGVGSVGTLEAMRRLGADFIVYGSDVSLLRDAISAGIEDIKQRCAAIA